MKALTFLEYYQANIQPKWKENLIDCLLAIKAYEAFVSQPFKPEMIGELFVGWGKDITPVYNYVNANSRIGFGVANIGTPFFYDEIRFLTNGGILCFIAPQTLNDFISNCQRAGIELTFKEGISKKLF